MTFLVDDKNGADSSLIVVDFMFFLVSEWISLVTFGGVSGFIGYSVYTTAKMHYSSIKGNQVNLTIKKDADKVVDTVDVEDIGKKAVFCRCWKSKKVSYRFHLQRWTEGKSLVRHGACAYVVMKFNYFPFHFSFIVPKDNQL